MAHGLGQAVAMTVREDPSVHDVTYLEIWANEDFGVAEFVGDDERRREVWHGLHDEAGLTDVAGLGWRSSLPHPPDLVWGLPKVDLLSTRIKEILVSQAGPRDSIRWIPATVTAAGGEVLDYWIAHFATHFDVLDERHTTWGPSGLPIRWVLDREKLEGLSVFHVPKASGIIVSSSIAEALDAANLTGYRTQVARMV